MTDRLLKIIFELIVFIAAVHFVSLKFYLYYEFWWLDIVMHFLGGLWVALSLFWLFDFARLFKINFSKISHLILSAVFLTILVAIAWEIFELQFGITSFLEADYLEDTIFDIFVGFSGALTASLAFLKFSSKQKSFNGSE